MLTSQIVRCAKICNNLDDLRVRIFLIRSFRESKNIQTDGGTYRHTFRIICV